MFARISLVRTVNLSSTQQLKELTSTLEHLLEDGKQLSVTVAEADELLSPQAVAARLGFSRQHVRRLVDAGELEGRQMANSRYWKIPLSSVLAFEQRRERGREVTDAWASELDALGAPAE
jgi:excisionase family DNA binding protein